MQEPRNVFAKIFVPEDLSSDEESESEEEDSTSADSDAEQGEYASDEGQRRPTGE